MRDIRIKSVNENKKPEESLGLKEKPKKSHGCLFLVLVVFLSLIVGAAGGVLGDKLLIPYLATLPQFENNEFFTQKGTTVTVQKTEEVKIEESNVLIDAVRKVSPAVVAILEEGGFNEITKEIKEINNAGSGFIITADGLIVTDKNLVADVSKNYFVVLQSGASHEVKSVIADPLTQCAFLKIEADNLPVMELGISDDLKNGERVFALSYLENKKGFSLPGFITAQKREIRVPKKETVHEAILTDETHSGEYAGGPLVNLEGKAMGLNTRFKTETEEVSFFTPIDDVKNAYNLYLKSNEIKRPYLGVNYLNLTPEFSNLNNLAVKNGAFIYGDLEKTAVEADSPAKKAKLQAGDIITKINGKDVDLENSFTRQFLKLSPGQEVEITYLRANQEKKVKVMLLEKE